MNEAATTADQTGTEVPQSSDRAKADRSPTGPAAEQTVMIAWPGVASLAAGRWLGRWVEATPARGWGHVLTLRNLVLLASAPLALMLFAVLYAPGYCPRYRLTTRRVCRQHGYTSRTVAEVPLAGFDRIEAEVQPGQEWHLAADLVFYQGDEERLRLPGISRPEAFRRTCLKTQAAYAKR